MPAALLATDRCDRCGARAAIRVVHGLLFCAHHGRILGFLDSLPRTTPAATSGQAGEQATP